MYYGDMNLLSHGLLPYLMNCKSLRLLSLFAHFQRTNALSSVDYGATFLGETPVFDESKFIGSRGFWLPAPGRSDDGMPFSDQKLFYGIQFDSTFTTLSGC